MKSLPCMLAVLACAVSFVPASFAEAPDCEAEVVSGDAGIYFDAAGTRFTTYVAPFVAFDVYAIGFDLPGGVLGFELAITGLEGLTVLATQFLGGANHGDVPGEFIVTTGACLDGSGVVLLARLTVGSFTGASLVDRLLCLGGTDPSSFEGFNGVPGYLQCDGGLRPFTPAVNCSPIFPGACGVLNATFDFDACPLEDASFGTLKAAF